jgi:hypothetical protein
MPTNDERVDNMKRKYDMLAENSHKSYAPPRNRRSNQIQRLTDIVIDYANDPDNQDSPVLSIQQVGQLLREDSLFIRIQALDTQVQEMIRPPEEISVKDKATILKFLNKYYHNPEINSYGGADDFMLFSTIEDGGYLAGERTAIISKHKSSAEVVKKQYKDSKNGVRDGFIRKVQMLSLCNRSSSSSSQCRTLSTRVTFTASPIPAPARTRRFLWKSARQSWLLTYDINL